MSFNKILTRVLLLSTALALTAFSVCLAVSAKPKSQPELPFTKEMQEVLVNGLKKYNGKGISVAVIVPGYKPWVGVSGVSHDATPIKSDTVFDAGSITKNFVAALTLRLVEKGLLALDDPLHKWLCNTGFFAVLKPLISPTYRYPSVFINRCDIVLIYQL